MKKINLLVLLLFTATIFAQTQTQKAYIEVTGIAETELSPNEIYLDICIKERTEKGKKLTIDFLENQLKARDFGEVEPKIRNPKNSWIHFQTKSKKKLYIEHENNVAIYWGIEKEDIINTNDYNLEDFDIDDIRVSKYFDSNEINEIYLNDFNLDNTFNLMNENHRKEVIKKMVDEINDYAKRLGL